MPSNDVQELLDRAAITDTLYRIARAMDSKDWDLLAAGYTEDAQGDYVNAAASGRTEIVEAPGLSWGRSMRPITPCTTSRSASTATSPPPTPR